VTAIHNTACTVWHPVHTQPETHAATTLHYL